MKIWELSISDIDFTKFRLTEESEIAKLKKTVDDIIDLTQSVINLWEPLILLKDEQKIDPDFFDLYDLGCVIVNSRVKKIISSIMENDEYEMLPLLNDEDEYFLFNCLKIVDCLRKEESVYDELNSDLIVDYEYLVFNDEQLVGVPIFKIPQLPHKVFITTNFRFLYDEFDLKGIDFDDENLVYID